MDDFLKKYIKKYEEWIRDDRISVSSKIIPVNESLSAQQWVIPAEQVEKIVSGARFIALQKCVCRAHYSRCGKSLEVCLILNEAGKKFVSKGEARQISLPEAMDVLRKADEEGLVHLSLYKPDHEVFALCSCCSCCCHDLQLVMTYNRRDLMKRADYVAVTDTDQCIHCGNCAGRCIFGARTFKDNQMRYNTAACLGCGLCVTPCPVQATTMKKRERDEEHK